MKASHEPNGKKLKQCEASGADDFDMIVAH